MNIVLCGAQRLTVFYHTMPVKSNAGIKSLPLYGKNIEIEITSKIRDEKKFSGLEELRTQIEKDVKECLKL